MSDKSKQSKAQEAQEPVAAFARNLHISPRKLRLAADLVRGMNVASALQQLEHMPNKGALVVKKLVMSAMANAKNNFHQNVDSLYIQKIYCDAGPVLKRGTPRAKGSSFIVRHRWSHLSVFLASGSIKSAKQFKSGILSGIRSKVSSAKVLSAAPLSTGQSLPDTKVEGMDKASKTPKEKIIKSEEQRKQGRVQQKRRLFNRKTGE